MERLTKRSLHVKKEIQVRIVIASILVSLLAGCVSPAAVSALKDGISVNKGHMEDDSLPQEARDIGMDNYDWGNQILFNLCGDELPDDTAAREAARKKAADDKKAAEEAAASDGDQ